MDDSTVINWTGIGGRVVWAIALVAVGGMTLSGCGAPGGSGMLTGLDVPRPDGWNETTHGNKSAPDYATVFPKDQVNQILITVSPGDWESMQANMAELFGPAGGPPAGGRPALPPRPGEGGFVPGEPSMVDGAVPRAPGIPGWVDVTPENPTWVPATIEFEGLTWTNVGVRYKGNSSLRSGWNSESAKLPFKLDFDEFEDDHPEIEGQRFYGFKQLSLSNAFMDGSYMRDVLAAEILADAGLVAAETAYYEVTIDYGEGPVNLGLYVAIEVIDDTVIERYFDDGSGNIYEADGPGASLAQNSHAYVSSSFLKESNREEADWSDVEGLYSVLHSEARLSDPASWRGELESTFAVDGFLQWLAISAVIQHWDTYGQMFHNFYLYHDPESDVLQWISWDHNQVLAGGSMLGDQGGRAPGGMSRTVSLDRDEVGAGWPLVRYVLDDPVYGERYLEFMRETIDGAFDPELLAARCWELADLIGPYAGAELGEVSFRKAVQGLVDRIHQRHQLTTAFLADGREG